MHNQNSTNWFKRHFWVICVDALGAGLLISLLMAANGAPALKPAMLALLTLVPFTALFIMLTDRRAKPVAQPTAPIIRTRTIYTTTRPTDQRA